MNFVNNLKNVFAGSAMDELDRADLVQTIIITAGFAVAGFLIVNWISTAIINKGADVAQCIEGANTYQTTNSTNNCQTADHAKTNSFQNDTGFKSRFGTK